MNQKLSKYNTIGIYYNPRVFMIIPQLTLGIGPDLFRYQIYFSIRWILFQFEIRIAICWNKKEIQRFIDSR
jgi:hypothetical protein